MNDGDPEQRVRDLEQPLAESAAVTEPPPNRAGLRLGWIVLGLLILGLLVGGGAMIAEQIAAQDKPVAGRPTTAEITGGGSSFTAASPAPPLPAAPQIPAVPQIPAAPEIPVAPQTPVSREISVAGVGKDETHACDETVVSVSGVDNTVTLTGRCSRVDISGIGNTVFIEESGAIVVSGMNNVVSYRYGSPQLTRSGMNNTLERG